MKIYFNSLKIIIYLFSFFALSACTNFRSAEGMKKNEIGLNYVFPSTGSIRYGLTNNLESRLTFSKLERKDQCLNADLFYHSSNEAVSFLKYGFMVGYWHNQTNKSNYYYGFTTSHKINDYWIPYISLTSNNSIYNHEGKFPGYFSIGTEIIIPLNQRKSVKLNLIPEGLFILEKPSEFFDGPTLLSINIGFSIELDK